MEEQNKNEKNIKIYFSSIIYVASPSNVATGGPELLHQLVYHLRNDLNINTFMYYFPNDISNPIPQEYQQYKNPFSREIEDRKENILIVPEIPDGVKILKNYSKIRKCVWLLGINNLYLPNLNSKKTFFFYRLINKIWKIFFNEPLINLEPKIYKKINLSSTKLPEEIKNADFYLVQSFYALNHLINKGIPNEKIFFLSDYLNEDFLKIKTDLSKKQNIVAYNPKKGYNFTKKIIKRAPDIKFFPIINMTRQQVIEALQKAKVYIDFGNHPGKDRVPREAAILGCCVLTNKLGSASFYEDVPIPNEYKFDDKNKNIPKIINKIRDCFDNFNERYQNFNYYREFIRKEPQKFLEDLRKIFEKVS